MPKISIIIVCYNSNHLIKNCIDSILKYNDIGAENIEIIIVDNSAEINHKKLQTLLRSLYGNKVKIVKNEKNSGYGHGNNVGINLASGEIICIMNPDVRLIEPLYRKTLKHFQLNKKLGMLSFKQKGGIDLSFYIQPQHLIPLISTTVITRLLNRFNIFNSNFLYLSGAFIFLSKDLFLQSGKFDENIFLYHEESDITMRLKKIGASIKFDGTKKYYHIMENRKFEIKTYDQIFKSAEYYLVKNGFNKNTFFKRMLLESYIKLSWFYLCRDKNGITNQKEIIYILKENYYPSSSTIAEGK